MAARMDEGLRWLRIQRSDAGALYLLLSGTVYGMRAPPMVYR